MSDTAWHGLTILLSTAVGVMALLLVALMRQVGSLMLRLEPIFYGAEQHEPEGGPEIGAVIEPIEGVRYEEGAVVVFLGTGCIACEDLLPAIPVVAGTYPSVDLIAAVGPGQQRAREIYRRKLGDLARLDLAELHERWDIPGTPFAVAVDPSERVLMKGVVNRLDQLAKMADAVTEAGIQIREAAAAQGNGPVEDGVAVGTVSRNRE